jgi:hypothetical protein
LSSTKIKIIIDSHEKSIQENKLESVLWYFKRMICPFHDGNKTNGRQQKSPKH